MAITRLGKNLHYIHLGHCSRITDVGVTSLVKLCNRIRYIDLACCTALTDASVMQLASLPKLKRIGLVKCAAITDRSIFALAKPKQIGSSGPIAPSVLERVHLSYCTNLSLAVSLSLFFVRLCLLLTDPGHPCAIEQLSPLDPSFSHRHSSLFARRPSRLLS